MAIKLKPSTNSKTKKTYMTTREVAETCNVSISSVYYWMKEKKHFQTKKIGGRHYILRDDLKAFLKKGGIGL